MQKERLAAMVAGLDVGFELLAVLHFESKVMEQVPRGRVELFRRPVRHLLGGKQISPLSQRTPLELRALLPKASLWETRPIKQNLFRVAISFGDEKIKL